jgi:hypothetical protein
MLKFARTVGGVGRKLELVDLGVSQTYELGDVIKTYSNGVGDLGAAATPVLGVIVAFVSGVRGEVMKSAEVVAGTAASSDYTTVTSDGTNSDDYRAIVDVSKDTVYSAEVSGTLGTTNDSNLIGCRIDVNSAGAEYGQVLETTATRTVATTANFYSWGLDPNDSTRLMVSIASSECQSDANSES